MNIDLRSLNLNKVSICTLELCDDFGEVSDDFFGV